MEELLAYGPLGIFAVALATGLIVPKSQVDRLITERDEAISQRNDLANDVVTQVAPMLERATRTIEARESFEAQVFEVMVDVRRLLEGNGP